MTQPTPQQTFDEAVRLHQSGKLQDAERLYHQVLAAQPDHSRTLQYLGVLANQTGRIPLALELIHRAIDITPGDPIAHFNLGIAQKDAGNLDESIAAYRRSISLDPTYAQAHGNLANVLMDNGQFDEAIASHHQALSLNPDHPDAHNNLGTALKKIDRLDEAIEAYQKAIALRPNFPEAHFNLGNALADKKQIEQAIAAYHRAISLRPNYAQAFVNLASCLRDNEQLQESHAACRQAIALNPNLPAAHLNLGNVLKDGGFLDESVAAFRQSIALKPDYAEAHFALGVALKSQDRIDEAIACFRQAIALRPNFREPYLYLGISLKSQAKLDEAIAVYRQALAKFPDYNDAHGNLILAMHYNPAYDAQSIAQELNRWKKRHADPLQKFIQPHAPDPNPNRPLRIGYISADFRKHPVGRNLLPLFQHHDHNLFHVTAYSAVEAPDALTTQFQQNADAWREVAKLSDHDLAQQIRQDQIDILLDLSVHTGGNRLLVFARKPAPIQVTYLGYPGSTGLDTIDYRISDPHIDPPGQDESCYTEKTIRLPNTYWCYQPGDASALTPVPSPALKNGYITFGCQNNYCKLCLPVWTSWSAILKATPHSKLLVYSPPGSHRETARETLANLGIDPTRLTFSDARNQDYFRTYNQIDIALDPFPFTGGHTTCDALWMGVPTITLSGQTPVSRGGRSILSNLGLFDLIARTPEEYVQIAVTLAGDVNRLDSLRQSIRPRMQASSLMNPHQFARDMESAYRQIWRTWCEKQPPECQPT
ncbi:MAG: tetratricopeptide repeat protein [Tepidisphaeraceae bacterium]